MYVFNSETKAGKKDLEGIWPQRSCQPRHLQVSSGEGQSPSNDGVLRASRLSYLHRRRSSASRPPTRVFSFDLLWGRSHRAIEEPSDRFQDQHFEQLQSHCSSIASTGGGQRSLLFVL